MYYPIKNWSNRSKKSFDGYIIVRVISHPKSFGGWYYEHRLVLERELDRILEDWETIHHINGDKSDNRLENLFLCTRAQHDKAHRTKDGN